MNPIVGSTHFRFDFAARIPKYIPATSQITAAPMTRERVAGIA
jgi:hypothetical protein